jgi:hypothetical protein
MRRAGFFTAAFYGHMTACASCHGQVGVAATSTRKLRGDRADRCTGWAQAAGRVRAVARTSARSKMPVPRHTLAGRINPGAVYAIVWKSLIVAAIVNAGEGAGGRRPTLSRSTTHHAVHRCRVHSMICSMSQWQVSTPRLAYTCALATMSAGRSRSAAIARCFRIF